MKVIELGNAMDCDPVTTCVIIPASEGDIEDAKKKAIKGKQQILFKTCFQQLRGEGIGKSNPAGVGWPEPNTFWCIHEEEIKAHFMGKVSASNPTSTYKQAYNGPLSGLLLNTSYPSDGPHCGRLGGTRKL